MESGEQDAHQWEHRRNLGLGAHPLTCMSPTTATTIMWPNLNAFRTYCFLPLYALFYILGLLLS